MEQIFFLCPATQAEYLHILQAVTSRLDDAGVSFHVCRPGEDIAGTVIECHSKGVSK